MTMSRIGASTINHGTLDRVLLANPVFRRRSAAQPNAKEELLQAEPYFRFKRVLLEANRVAPLRPESDWLDLGCHAGEFMSLVKNATGARVTGVDDWDVKSQWTEEEYEYLRHDLATDWPSALGAKRYDYVSALEVIEHIIDTDLFLDRIRQVLVDGGFLLLTTPNINSLRNRVLVPLGRYPASMEWRNTLHHVRMYNASAVEQQLRSRGFRVDSITGVTFLPERFNRLVPARHASEWLGQLLPTLCNNLIVIARKERSGSPSV